MTLFSTELLEVNEDAIRALVPAYIYMTLIMSMGRGMVNSSEFKFVPTNSSHFLFWKYVFWKYVIYFYGIKQKTSPHILFIVVLAIFDLFTCAVAMPLELVDLVRFYTYESTELCKITRLCTHFGPIASTFTLLVIAVDRYRMVCEPLKLQISSKLSKILLLLAAVFGIVVSVPASVFYQVVEANLTEPSGLSAYDCTTIRDEEYTVAITVYNINFFFLLSGSIVVLFVLYLLVARELFKLRKANLSSTSHNVKVKKFTAIMMTNIDNDHIPVYSTKSIIQKIRNRRHTKS
ncbi:hypothetical protein FSP39_000106 [Pinctada imbricata]|uniref:G-protein coupled receptors family 1 profile domain-containing protein n=1 Tax=Pinctada imbricata TaxID=66713 RepID=A0AA88XKJ8_PINIB|nr:hypothetical protein FSP39_000106 [Pinctada imbricata]